MQACHIQKAGATEQFVQPIHYLSLCRISDLGTLHALLVHTVLQHLGDCMVTS